MATEVAGNRPRCLAGIAPVELYGEGPVSRNTGDRHLNNVLIASPTSVSATDVSIGIGRP